MPDVPSSAAASASAYSWFGPPLPLPRIVTVSSPPDTITARLPLDAVAERHELVTGAFDLAADSGERVGGFGDDREAGAGENLVARLRRLVLRVIERARHRFGQFEPVARDHRARIGERRRV